MKIHTGTFLWQEDDSMNKIPYNELITRGHTRTFRALVPVTRYHCGAADWVSANARADTLYFSSSYFARGLVRSLHSFRAGTAGM